MKQNLKKILDTKCYLKNNINIRPTIGLILGSGLGILANEIKSPTIIAYRDIPNFPVSTVEGHAGQLIVGELMGKHVIALKGRPHYYEGYSMDEITFPVMVMNSMDIRQIIITNAAGGINKNFTPGDLMIIKDYINLGFGKPLIGFDSDKPNMNFLHTPSVYSKNLITLAKKIAEENNMNIKEGVYAFTTGPNYETPAEIKMMSILGADAVGMSTVPEIIASVRSKVEILGISCITNMAAGISHKPLSHEEVITVAQKVKKSFVTYIKAIIKDI